MRMRSLGAAPSEEVTARAVKVRRFIEFSLVAELVSWFVAE
jgi:hypothetical protein